MSPWIKRILIALGALVLLVVVAAVAVVAFFDPNQYKGAIVQAVKDKKNRTLKIEGDLKLTLFPQLGVDLGRTTLSEFGNDKAFASVESAHVAVAVMPLLSKRVVVDKVKVDGLRATVIRRRDGHFNFDDLLQPSEEPSPVQFDIQGVNLSRGELTYLDEKEKNTVKVTQLELKSGRIADKTPSDVALSARVSADIPPADVKLAANGTLRLDLGAKQIEWKGGKLEIAGVLPHVKADRLTVEGDRLLYDTQGSALSSRDLSLGFKGVVDNEPLELQLKAPAFSVDLLRLALHSEKLDVDVRANGAERKGTLKLEANRLDARIADGIVDVEKLKATGKGTISGVTLSDLVLSAPKLAADLPKSQLALEGIDLRAAGTRAGDRFEATLQAPRLQASATQAAGSGIQGKVKLSGAKSLDLAYRIDEIAGSGNAMTAKLDAQGSLDAPNLPVRPIKIAAAGTLRGELAAEKLTAQLKGSADQSQFDATIAVEHFAKPAITFAAAIDQLNLDRYQTKTAEGGRGGGAGKVADPAIDFSGLKPFNLTGQLRVGALQVQRVRTTNVAMAVRVANGRADVRDMSAALYGGSLAGGASLDGNTNAFAVKTTLTNVQVGPLLKDLANRDTLEGRGTVKLDVTGSGKTLGAMKKSLAGNVDLHLRDGSIKGFNLGKSLRDLRNKVLARSNESAAQDRNEKTDFSELTAQATLVGGVATVRDLQVKSPLIRATQGNPARIDIGNSSLDFVLRAMLVNTGTGQGGKELRELKDITVPVLITGPFEHWQYQIQWASITSEALRGTVQQKLQEQLSGKLGLTKPGEPAPAQKGAAKPAEPQPQPKKSAEDELKEKAKERLRGLFGK